MSIVIEKSGNQSRHAVTSVASTSATGFASSSLSSRLYVTPDSSVSPHLAPKEDGRAVSPGFVDSETDDLYMDGIDDDTARGDITGLRSSPSLDATSARIEEDPAVALSTLAEVYLPAIFAQHGPCVIRHLTQYLAINNLEFGELAPGKQRRLIVKALESKKGVLFEKVGWGRWNHIENKSSDSGLFTPEAMPQTCGSQSGSLLSSTFKNSLTSAGRLGNQRPPVMGSYPISSFSSHQEFMFSPSLSVAETSREDEDDADIDPLDLDMEGDDSDTDEEDWKSVGAEALRARSNNASTPGSLRESTNHLGSYSGGQRSSPYPIRRKSSAGVYQMNSPHLQAGSFSKSPSLSRPSFPKTSSYLKSSPISNARATSFVRVRDVKTQQPSQTRSDVLSTAGSGNEPRDSQADAVEALVMLSGSFDER